MSISVSREQLANIRQWFSDYTEGFQHDDAEIRQNIELKKTHTERVCREILDIGEALGLNADEQRLAEIIALLHDAGRFPQYVHYGTFKDSVAGNHALMGLEVIREHRLLDPLDATVRRIVLRAVRYHNRIALPEGEEQPFLFYEKLIRDADKLDVWKVVLDYYYREDRTRNNAIELDLPDTPGYSSSVVEDLRKKKIVDLKHVKNMNDFKLLQMGWIFDINFVPTRERIAERRYLQRLRAVLPPSEALDDILDLMLELLQKPV